MCRVAAFYEGGISYTELASMPIDELFAIVDCANRINEERKAQVKNGK